MCAEAVVRKQKGSSREALPVVAQSAVGSGQVGTNETELEECGMAIKKAKSTDKALTKAKIVEVLAEESGLAKKDVAALLAVQAELACAQAVVGFTIPGIGKLVVVNRKARKGRNPATGEAIKIPAKKVLKFRIAKAAKDAITPPKK